MLDLFLRSKMPANFYPKANLGKMEIVNDAYWRKRKQRLEKMFEEFQKTGWKTGGELAHSTCQTKQ